MRCVLYAVPSIGNNKKQNHTIAFYFLLQFTTIHVFESVKHVPICGTPPPIVPFTQRCNLSKYISKWIMLWFDFIITALYRQVAQPSIQPTCFAAQGFICPLLKFSPWQLWVWFCVCMWFLSLHCIISFGGLNCFLSESVFYLLLFPSL